MKPRLSTSLLLVVTAALALVIGAVGSATASGISRGAVKKIAAKVVAKSAPKLSVAHAATADSAATATTAGRAGKVAAYTYTIPVLGNPTMQRSVTFPGLPAGTYLATYAVAGNVGAGGSLNCGFVNGSYAPSYAVAAAPASFVTVGASAVVTVAGAFSLDCSGTNNFEFNPYYGRTVSFVAVDGATQTAGGG